MSVFCFFWISDILENDMTHTEYVKKGIKWQQCEATLCVRWCLTTKTLSLSLFVTLTSLSWHLALWNLICFNSSCLEVLDILFLTWIFFGPNVIRLISNISVSYDFRIKQIKWLITKFSLFLIQFFVGMLKFIMVKVFLIWIRVWFDCKHGKIVDVLYPWIDPGSPVQDKSKSKDSKTFLGLVIEDGLMSKWFVR